jgi:hypothetical protein
MGYELEVIGPHVAPTCEEKRTVQWLSWSRVRNSEVEQCEVVVTVVEDVVLRLWRVGRRLPHDPSSRERPCHLRRTPPEPRRKWRRRKTRERICGGSCCVAVCVAVGRWGYGRWIAKTLTCGRPRKRSVSRGALHRFPFWFVVFWEVAYADRSPCCCREEDRSCLASASVGDGEFARARSWRRRACSCPTGTRLEGKVLVGIHGGRGKEGSPGGVSWSGGGRDCWAARRLGTRGRGGQRACSWLGSISISIPSLLGLCWAAQRN